MPDIQVVLNQTLYSQQVRNVLHFFYDADLDETGLTDIADYIRSSWVAAGLDDVQVNNWQLDSVSIRECASTGPYAEIPFTGGILVGASASAEAVSQAAALVTLISSSLTQPTRGRIYFAGVNNGAIFTNGEWAAGLLDILEDLVNSWRNATTAGSQFLDLRIASRNPDGTCDVLNVVTNVIARSRIATQRRRRIGVGG